jgi:sugar O-acyltransferase (sialic acid O-acetyltransferase NeuD family)
MDGGATITPGSTAAALCWRLDAQCGMRDIVIVGVGGHGAEIAELIESLREAGHALRLRGFVDDQPAAVVPAGHILLGAVDALFGMSARTEHVIAVGDPALREAVAGRLAGAGKAATLIHPDATVGGDVHLAEGCVVFAGARLTTRIALGRHVHINLNSTVSHDCELGDFTTLSPGVSLSGATRTGEGVLFGTGAVTLPGVSIGRASVVGAGAVVTADVSPGVTVAGIPARAVGS